MLNRRNFLELSSSALSLPILANTAFSKNNGQGHGRGGFTVPKNEKSVVFLFLEGGPSHFELTHAHPESASAYRSVTGECKTKTPGLYFGGLLPKLADRSNYLNVVHSYSHKSANHQNAKYWQFSGKVSNNLSQTEPSYGSIASRVFGATNPNTGIPTYLCTNRVDGDAGAWIGSGYNPFEANEKGTRDLTLGVSPERLAFRLRVLDTIEKRYSFLSDQAWKDSNKLKQQALDLITGDIRKAFEVKHESDAIRDAYGRTFIGDSLLLSRRLIQNGGRFINISFGGWDMHQNIKQGMDRLCPQLDKAVAAFMDDIKNKGMEKDVLLVITGDFGRTPKLNNTAGRDHFPNVCPLVFFGGDYESGRVIGKADRLGTEVVENPFEPASLAYTIFNHLGMNPNMSITDNDRRPRYITEAHGKNILV